MIRWLQPGAFYGLLLVAAPVLIHLLRNRRARRSLFPTLRFVRPSATASVRIQSPSDLFLLALRLAIVALAVCAAAGPVILTSGRRAVWNARIARAVIVDTSESMREATSGGRSAADLAEEAARVEQTSATFAARFDSRDPGRILGRAAAWLREAPPARREIVIVSDFQSGALAESDVSGLPPHVGLRLMKVGADTASRVIPGLVGFGTTGISARAQQIILTVDGTAMTSTARPPVASQAIRILGSTSEVPDMERLLRAVAAAGAPAPSDREPLAFVFPSGIAQGPPVTRAREGWMLRTIVRLQQNTRLHHLLEDSQTRLTAPVAEPWTSVARNRRGDPLVEVAASGRELVIRIGVAPSSLEAAAAIRATLVERHGSTGYPDAEIMQTPAEMLARWSKPAGDVQKDAWRTVESSDGRWFWLAVLILLAAEQGARSRVQRRASDRSDDRAAA